MSVHTFCSDNCAGLCPEARRAIADISGHAASYGDDASTAEAVGALQRIFGAETSAWFVATGTAANTLAIASLTQPWQHRNAFMKNMAERED